MKQFILFLVSVAAGLVLTFIDTRPNWDDTGVFVIALLIASGLVGLLVQKKPWLYALAIGIWLPLWYIITKGELLMIIPLGIAFIGVYGGYIVRHMLRGVRQVN
jgi:hypothetical protein